MRNNLSYDKIELENESFSMRQNISALILAGGKSCRMGADKALLEAGGITIVERILRQLRELFPEVLISANNPQKFSFLGVRVVEDLCPGAGPIAGIAAGLSAAANELLFVTACDIPEIDIAFVQKLLALAPEYEIVVPVTADGHYEPLHAVYRRSVLGRIEELLSQGVFKIIELYDRCETQEVYASSRTPLRNLNTREDYSSYLRFLLENR